MFLPDGIVNLIATFSLQSLWLSKMIPLEIGLTVKNHNIHHFFGFEKNFKNHFDNIN